MAALTEDIVKFILHKEGLPVPGHFTTADVEGLKQYQNLSQNVVVKPAVPVGRRGKAGAIEFAANMDEVTASFRRLKKKKIYGFDVHKVLVEEKIEISRELFLSFTFDSRMQGLLMMVSPEGGIDVERIVQEKPDKLVRLEIDPYHGIQLHDAVEAWSKAGISGALLPAIAGLTCRLYQVFVKYDSLGLSGPLHFRMRLGEKSCRFSPVFCGQHAQPSFVDLIRRRAA